MSALNADADADAKSTAAAQPAVQTFVKDTLVNGLPVRQECVRVDAQTFAVERGALTIVRPEDEWFDDVTDAPRVVAALRDSGVKADLFTFWQRIPHHAQAHAYATEQEGWAVLAVSTYDHWWNHQIKSRVRSQIRKAQKEGRVVKEVPFDDEFVRGMTEIFNESPVRQGRRFWHYGKDFDTVKAQFSRFTYRERMIGAYFNDTLVGFVMLANAGRFALAGQIIASLHHRDKQPNASLVAKAVELCQEQGLDHLVYGYWTEDSLSEFKRRCGFEPVQVPRYHVSLSWKGSVALRCGLHHGWKHWIPERIKQPLKQARRAWNERQAPADAPAG